MEGYCVMNLLLLGAPGSGKDTLAANLGAHKYKILTTGALYRKEYEDKTELGLEAYSYWGKGNLCPDEMTNQLMFNILSKSDKNNLIFNGYPRTLQQAKYLDTLSNIDLVFNLITPDEIAVGRLLKRARLDDTEESIKQRLKHYYTNSVEMVKYYKSRNIYFELNTNREKEEVLKEALGIINETCQNHT